MIPEAKAFGSLAEIKEGSSVTSDIAYSSTGVDFPLAEDTEFSFDNHSGIL